MNKSKGKFPNKKGSDGERNSYDQDRPKSFIPSKDKDNRFGNSKFRDSDSSSGNDERRRSSQDEERPGPKRFSGSRPDALPAGPRNNDSRGDSRNNDSRSSNSRDTGSGNFNRRDSDNRSRDTRDAGSRNFGSGERNPRISDSRKYESRKDDFEPDDFDTDDFRKGKGRRQEKSQGRRSDSGEGDGRYRKSPAGEDGFGRKRPADFKSGEGKKRKFTDSADREEKFTGAGKSIRKGNIPKADPPVYDALSFLPGERKKVSADEKNIRLNKYIADAGVCSRREADSLISAGEIKVNGEVITEMGYKVARKDTVTYNGTVLKAEKLVYVLLNKPKGFITTVEDPEDRKTVMHLVENACEERIYPVGRLDRNTTGLLLVTNDGDLAKKLTHPSHNVKKIYQVDLDKPLTEEDVEKLQSGIMLEDGEAKVDELAVLSEDRTILGVEIHIGRNRIVRRMFEHLGYEVIRLDRVMFAGLTKKDLPRGKWRYLSEKELIRLKHFK